MPAHIIRRKDCGGTFYLVDGELTKTLKTKTRRYAEVLLRQYLDGKHDLGRTPTVQQFYERWIERKIEPLVRRSQIRDYRQAFGRYILPRFKDKCLAEIGTGDLKDFQIELLKKGLAVKTCRNIVDGSFRAMYRDAKAEIPEISGKDPFIDVRWPKARRERPDPFSAAERDKILAYLAEVEPFYFPFVSFQFQTGCRPSESTALTWADLNRETRTIRIDKSRNLNADNDTKTTKSRRSIIVTAELMDLLYALRHPWTKESDKVFLNKTGAPLNADQFRADYWGRVLEALEIRKRKFYACRHTLITEMVKAGLNLKAIAQYVGTSVAMIEDNYCGNLELDPTIFQRAAGNFLNSLASPTGFEPVLSA